MFGIATGTVLEVAGGQSDLSACRCASQHSRTSGTLLSLWLPRSGPPSCGFVGLVSVSASRPVGARILSRSILELVG